MAVFFSLGVLDFRFQKIRHSVAAEEKNGVQKQMFRQEGVRERREPEVRSGKEFGNARGEERLLIR